MISLFNNQTNNKFQPFNLDYDIVCYTVLVLYMSDGLSRQFKVDFER